MQIDDLLRKLDSKEGEVSRMIEEKDQELMILQEGMDSTLQEMNDLRLVRLSWQRTRFLHSALRRFDRLRTTARPTMRLPLRSTL